MASLTPGVLLKLLQSMNTDAKVAGEHRSAVLQVVGIVPVLSSSSTADDLWPAHGYYLQLSDSAHSTYVALSDAEADAVLSSRPQLGQLVHVDRFRFAHPYPRAVGLRPVPGARPHPFIGSPEALVARPSPHLSGFVIQSSTSPAVDAAQPIIPSSSSNASLQSNTYSEEAKRSVFAAEEAKRTVFAAKENVVGSEKNNGKPRRFSSPAAAKSGSRRSSNGEAEQRDPSPAVKASPRPSSPALSRARPRQSSPAPSKCEVPSLVAAKEDSRRVAKEAATIVPSRYRQPSPVGGRKASSPMGRRASVSPARRFSGGLKVVSPAAGEEGGTKKVVAGVSRVSDVLMGPVKSVRKSWDHSPANSLGSSETKEKIVSKSRVDKEAILGTQAAKSLKLSDAEGIPTDSEEPSSVQKLRSSSKTEAFSDLEKKKSLSRTITVHDRKWTDGSIPLDAVSNGLAKLGKEALQRKNLASKAAAEALEEALATESVIRCLSIFSHLSSSSNIEKPLPTINLFLSIYQDVFKWNIIVESLYASRNVDGFKDVTVHSRSASLWVEAALATDLQVIHLLNQSSSESLSKLNVNERPAVLSVDPPRTTSTSKRQSIGTPAKGHPPKAQTNLMASNWTRGYGVSETLELAKALRREMQTWFLKFVEEAMDVGFHLFWEGSDDGHQTTHKDNGRVAAILSQLKRINDWLDGVGRTPEAETLKERIEHLKRKIYGFVISHIGSAFDHSVSVS